MDLTSLLVMNLAAVLAFFGAIWCVSLFLKDVSIVDVFWGPAYLLVAWLTLLRGDASSLRAWLIVLLVTVWALRLGSYLAWRNWGEEEDRRYREMREKHGAAFPLVSLFTVFGLQAVLVWIVSLPVQVGLVEPRGWSVLAVVGALLWLIGLLFESVGDYQLTRFKQDPENQDEVLDEGLWRYTRHPNYFGDFCVWWGLYLVAAEGDNWWWTIIGPIVMSVLLMRVSGVTLLEKSLKERKSGYQKYVERTNAFFPWPPQTDSS